MKRRNFIGSLALGGGMIATAKLGYGATEASLTNFENGSDLEADVIVAGGGLGGIASALALLRNGQNVILTEETDWIGGQLTQQGVPADEHPWIETHGAPKSYRVLRDGIRDYYKNNFPLTESAMNAEFLNPGNGIVSRICHEPKAALAVLMNMLAPYESNGQLLVLLEYKVISASVSQSVVRTLVAKSHKTNRTLKLKAPYFVDATELGDLLPLTGTEFIVGTESSDTTEELHAPKIADPNNQQAFTTCFAMDYIEGEDFAEKPKDYSFWSSYVPQIQPPWSGKQLSLSYSDPRTLAPKTLGFDPTGIKTGNTMNWWNYRRIIDRHNFKEGFYKGDVSLVNWPQNDFMLGNLLGVSERAFKKNVEASM